jgi:hypothetical protein
LTNLLFYFINKKVILNERKNIAVAISIALGLTLFPVVVIVATMGQIKIDMDLDSTANQFTAILSILCAAAFGLNARREGSAEMPYYLTMIS